MKKIILNTTVAFLLIFMSACSQKTTTPSTQTTTTASQEQASQRGQKGQRGGKRERPQFSDMLAKMDTNKDGMLSLVETDGDEKLKKGFTKIDINQDGFITAAEFENAPRPPRRGGRN